MNFFATTDIKREIDYMYFFFFTGSPEQKKKPGIFVRAKTWLVGKLRSFKKS